MTALLPFEVLLSDMDSLASLTVEEIEKKRDELKGLQDSLDRAEAKRVTTVSKNHEMMQELQNSLHTERFNFQIRLIPF